MTDFHRHTPDNRLPDNATTRLLAASDAAAYHRSLPGYAPTPLYALPGLAAQLGIGALYVKDEAPRFGLNAFKGLGASYAIAELLRENPDLETFCTATDGNHGRAVAWAARLTGKRAVVYVPHHTRPARIAAIEGEGAQVVHTASWPRLSEPAWFRFSEAVVHPVPLPPRRGGTKPLREKRSQTEPVSSPRPIIQLLICRFPNSFLLLNNENS